jgi:similar to stage IV sporulation protein
MPVLLHRYRRRIGLFPGVLLGALLLFLSTGVLWDIRVEGNKVLSEDEIIASLAECGLAIGTELRKTDTREVENRMLRMSEDIAWISVNVNGTVAHVQVREMQSPKGALSHETANLVAACDGVIDSVRLLSGEVVVNPGQQVRQGELLISGVRDSGVHGYCVLGARGEVMARTQQTVSVQIPLFYEEKVYTGQEKREKSLIFFGKTIKLSKNTGIVGGSCDTIYTEENVTLPGGVVLPISVRTVHRMPYELKTVERGREQAFALAQAALDEKMRSLADDVLLLSKTVKVFYSETHCVLVCEYSALQNIAVPQPLEVTGERVTQN